MVCCCNICFCIVPYVRVTVNVVINILQFYIRRTHAKTAHATKIETSIKETVAARGRVIIVFRISLCHPWYLREIEIAHIRHTAVCITWHLKEIKIAHIRHTAVCIAWHLREIEITHIRHTTVCITWHLREVKITHVRHSRNSPALVRFTRITRCIRVIHEIIHVKIFTVSTTTTKTHTIWFIQFTIIRAVISFKETVF